MLAAIVPRDVVTVTGPDATSFLQNLVSQDLEPVGVGESVHTLLLQPQGKLLVDFRAVHVEPDVWWCDCEGGFGRVLADGLERFKIRVKVDVELLDDTAMLAVRGFDALPAVGGAQVVRVAWPTAPGYDVIGPSATVQAAAGVAGLALADAAGYERARIEAGVPRQGLDVDERTIPQEAGLERDAVSFTKGCFVGQELACRIDSRGHVNRYLRRLRADRPVRRGADVAAGDRVVGEVTSAAGEVALAMLRREVEPGATVRVGDASAVVESI